ncbi:MAG: YggU family protein [Deltaproteobacteria bacterium]|nr:MAG: YggU family protein [Deltaproteobacteria bacterium]
MLWIKETADGVIFKVMAQPRASRNKIAGLQGDALKLRITAPPVEGAANKMCIELLAKTLKVRKSDIDIIQGQSGRTKKILVRSASRSDIESLAQPD